MNNDKRIALGIAIFLVGMAVGVFSPFASLVDTWDRFLYPGAALTISLLGGHVAVTCLQSILRFKLTPRRFINDFEPETMMAGIHWPIGVPPALMGIGERLLFTALTVIDPDDLFTLMVGWLALKMAANWNAKVVSAGASEKESQRARRSALIAVVSGVISMAFAYLGGWILRLCLLGP